MNKFSISGQLIDLHQRRIYPAEIQVSAGRIQKIKEISNAPQQYILPGFTDAHVHIESSMLAPAAFAQLAVIHGTVATVSDPHEIANVCGTEGVSWMIDNAKTVPFKCFFGAPSCVPATGFETAGAILDAASIDSLLQSPDIWYLAEMMNYPGVLHDDPEVMAKISAAKKWNKPVDGHAPGLRGIDVKKYAEAGITTDHECSTIEEALEKIATDMSILIREGSAAKNFEALHPLISSNPEKVMLCSDDKHPDDLVAGHINQLVQRALENGHDLFDVLRAACVNPVMHYGIPVGLLHEGDPADFILVNNLEDWKISKTFIDGIIVAEDGKCCFTSPKCMPINHFRATRRLQEDFIIPAKNGLNHVRVIAAHDGQLTTTSIQASLKAVNGVLETDTNQDILKLIVIDRYQPQSAPAMAFIKGFGFQQGAIASTVAHDCHNIIAVGVDDASICAAVNAIIGTQGGIAVASSVDNTVCLPLPIAGLMSDENGYEVGAKYAELSAAAKSLGSPLAAPFMTLSFMALLVIPALKLSDKGLFDGNKFEFTEVIG